MSQVAMTISGTPEEVREAVLGFAYLYGQSANVKVATEKEGAPNIKSGKAATKDPVKVDPTTNGVDVIQNGGKVAIPAPPPAAPAPSPEMKEQLY